MLLAYPIEKALSTRGNHMEQELRKSIAAEKAKLKEENREKKIRDKQLLATRTRIYNEMVAYQKVNKKKVKHSPEGAYISLRNINKIYDNKVQAVYDFSLDIKKHEFIVFVGPSGCGKSTTLRMIAGLEDITAGDLFIDKTYANDLHPKDRDIAMVFQSYALYPHMSVAGNISFGLKIKKRPEPVLDKNGNQVYGINKKAIKKLEVQLADYIKYRETVTDEAEKATLDESIETLKGKIEYLKENKVELFKNKHIPKEEIRERTLQAAKILQIDDYMDRKPKALSGGQCQRVALGRAIVKNSKVFLMDEPLSNLDAKLRVAMRAEIIRLHKALKATTIYVTHDQTEAMTMATRIVVMKAGYIQQIGTPIEIYNHPANMFVATFIGSPSMNIIKAQYENGKVYFDGGDVIELKKEYKDAVNEFYVKELAALKEELVNFDLNFVERNNILDKIKTLKDELPTSKNAAKLEQNLVKLEENLKLCEESASRRTYLINAIEKLETVDTNGRIDVVFGIRPEDIYQSNRVLTEDKISQPFDLEVSVAELLGHEYFCHSDFGGTEIVSKIHAKTIVNAGDKLNLVFDLSKIHLFDPTTQKIIK